MKKVFFYHFEGLQALLNETKASSSNRLYVFYKIGKNWQENTCARFSLLRTPFSENNSGRLFLKVIFVLIAF